MTNLKKTRIKKGLRQIDVAHALGCLRQAVYQQEKNGISKITTARKYAAVLKCDPLDLLD